MMEEFGLNDLKTLADHILEVSKNTTLKNLSELPRGKWHNTLDVDGYDEPVHLEALLTIGDSGLISILRELPRPVDSGSM